MGPVRIILASQSPRRRELLERMGILNFEIIPARGEEVLDPALPPERLVEELSRQKAAEVAAGAVPEDLVIAADTVVAVDGRVLGKMGHSERVADGLYKNVDGCYDMKLFQSAKKYFDI